MSDFEIIKVGSRSSEKALINKTTNAIVIPPNITKITTSGNYILGYCEPVIVDNDEMSKRWANTKGFFILNMKTKKLLDSLQEEDFNQQIKELGIVQISWESK